ncbi:hypothetical protein PHLGIDRAFT_451387 [Phlebiopsis gigantea 11061_1 CR5-6]|uniref:Uncharacterized protein n=1 Tax=Phlebiopsis gigantea (strain 11061_1 CR5-6) TaxID=745531 RepID=A0A0C3NNE1_PHLG1|nr:hypothetical protein PHLGIDRAFT_451387 [Phlebiopsis gigantea 11061_1 CR5-6]
MEVLARLYLNYARFHHWSVCVCTLLEAFLRHLPHCHSLQGLIFGCTHISRLDRLKSRVGFAPPYRKKGAA